MAHSNVAIAVARQVLWTFRDVADETVDSDFYTSMEPLVVSELARCFSNTARVWVGREVHLRIGHYTVKARLTNIDPLLADTVNSSTEFIAQYREQTKAEGQDI